MITARSMAVEVAVQQGGIAEIDMAVDHRHIQQPAGVGNTSGIGDLHRPAVAEVDAHQPAAAQGDKHRVMVEEFYPQGCGPGRSVQ